jgi:pimeloyl-ACP methyl ester carboxylesterase
MTGRVDFVEAGAGPLVVLVHSSMSGARQWPALMGDLQDRFLVRAVNLFGYGATPAWSDREPPSLDDFAALVAQSVPPTARRVSLIGHSFGGAVAMQAARRLGSRVERLVLIEPSLFYLLRAEGRHAAFAEIYALAARMHECAAIGALAAAAEMFIDYWSGPETWAASSDRRRAAYVAAVPLVLDDWNACVFGDTTLAQWAKVLPERTLVVSSSTPKRPSHEIMRLLCAACPDWRFERTVEGGHMAPLTHPHLINAIVARFLVSEREMADSVPA